jgi:hypothetical protein
MFVDTCGPVAVDPKETVNRDDVRSFLSAGDHSSLMATVATA